ncbi:hypothetical protein BJ912DRAFT_956110 [Pholiota molesta]|nr:hypothetical protein BJ912DRAFT_956110 [Pholiota molesta]
MPGPSSEPPTTTRPITRLPYDALREIFIHCLHRYPYREMQPNTKIAPLLLCHVCSSWRMVALSSAVLWSRLFCRLTIRYKDSKLKRSEIEFIRWWKKNHGLIPPFLILSRKNKDPRVITERLSGDGADEMPFLLEYITSAQYLELDPAFWATIRKELKAGYQVKFPNLRALEKSELVKNDPFHSVQALVAPHAFPELRYLSMVENFLDVDYKTPFPMHWSALTHISFCECSITLDFWYTFIRAVPNLQWASIDISELYDYEYYPSANILPCNLPHLSTLDFSFNDTPPYVARTPFRLLLGNFHTPSLRTLSLNWTISDKQLEDDSATVDELRAVLEALSTVETLALGGDFLSFEKRGCATMTLGGPAQPVWTHAKQLTEIQLELPVTHDRSRAEAEDALGTFVRNIFFCDNSWLALRNPACPIRTVSIMDDDQTILDLNTEAFTMSCIQKRAETVPNVVFQIVSTTAGYDVADVRNNWGGGI